jgi:diguanylate cyclase (GGDEF)-like protein
MSESGSGAGRATREVLTAVGAVPFVWTAADDRLLMGANALTVLGLDRLDVAGSGQDWTALTDPATPVGRDAAIARSVDTDSGAGVAYEATYAIRPQGPAGPQVALHEVGRWYSDGRGKPVRAEGVIRRLAQLPAIDPASSGTDALTGEMDRLGLTRALQTALAAAIAGTTGIALVFASIDTLDQINDIFGKAVGDEILRGAIERLKERMRAGDVIGRIGGNRLAILLSNCDEASSAIAGQRFVAGVRERPIATSVGPLWVTVSLGAVALPAQARTQDEALERADEALRRARKLGPGGLAVYQRDRHANTVRLENRELASEIAGLIADGHLQLGLIPIEALAGGVDGWRAAPAGPLAEFGVADLTALTDRLGLTPQVQLRLIDLVAHRLDADPKLSLTVDVGLASLATGAWLERARALFRRRRDLAARLTVALAARGIARLPEGAADFATAVTELGARLVIADFGAASTDPFAGLSLGPVGLEPAAALTERAAAGTDDAGVRALAQLAGGCRLRLTARGDFDAGARVHLAAAGFSHVEDRAGLVVEPVKRDGVSAA